MSTLKADTIQSTSGGAATLTKQEALKHWVNYDAVNQTVDGSLNQSSLTDVGQGEFDSNFSNNFGSASNKCHFAAGLNSADDGETRTASNLRGGSNMNIEHIVSDSTAVVLSTAEVQFYSAYGSTAASNGFNYDYSATYCSSVGDLA